MTAPLPVPVPAVGRRLRLLFVSEPASLAHIARLFVLASTLDPARYDIHFAAPARSSVETVLAGSSFTRWPLQSIPEELFMRRLRHGSPFWTAGDLSAYVADERRLIREIRPDFIVGDLRVSLSASCELEGVPWAAMINALWSPYAGGWRQPVPETRLSKRYLPVGTQFWFERLLPLLIRWNIRPLNLVRRDYGLRPHRPTFEAMFAGNHVLYVDPPGLIPFRRPPPAHHHFVGAAIWNAPAPLPAWWDELGDEPLIYATLGSSGNLTALPTILRGLADLPARIAVSVGGREAAVDMPANVFVAPYLPGDVLARRASLVITNGGSPALYQAFNEGTPVLAIPENLDQHMTMAAVAGHGATRSIRSDRLSPRNLRQEAERMLADPSFRGAAARVQGLFRAYPASAHFPRFVESALGPRSPVQAG